MRRSILFFALCSALDEASTFIHLQLGDIELNPRVAWLLGINPLLYPIVDIILVLLFLRIDKGLKEMRDLWLVWSSAGIARLVCIAWTLA